MKKPGKAKWLAIASLSAVVVLGASLAVAQKVKTGMQDGQGRHGWSGQGMGRGHRGGGALFSRLNLTDDQKAKLKEMRQSFGSTNKPLMDQLRAKRQELRQASEGGTFNEALATQKLTEMAGLQAKLMGARFQLHQQMLSVLTPEQKTQLDQIKAQFKERRGGRRGGFGGQREDE
ncbi:MAG TPA: Spy/CpxP family protein refolding chaperone [Pyrinomonadaceae bacterium]|nr:Spy/CpxP family protein refolding chaperone [Pyrinomonadaceae bacterium]